MADPSPQKRKRERDFGETVTERLVGEHRQTFVILHGRGSDAEESAPDLLAYQMADVGTIKDVLPHAKFVFPTAARTRATIWNRSLVYQWFHNWHLRDIDAQTELMLDGLHESCQYIHRMLEEEIAVVGS